MKGRALRVFIKWLSATDLSGCFILLTFEIFKWQQCTFNSEIFGILVTLCRFRFVLSSKVYDTEENHSRECFNLYKLLKMMSSTLVLLSVFILYLYLSLYNFAQMKLWYQDYYNLCWLQIIVQQNLMLMVWSKGWSLFKKLFTEAPFYHCFSSDWPFMLPYFTPSTILRLMRLFIHVFY